MKVFSNSHPLLSKLCLFRHLQAVPQRGEAILTQHPDAVLQGLHSAGLHGHAEHGLLPTNGAHLVLLGCLLEHHQQLVGDDGVEHGNDHHGEHEGDEGVDLQGQRWGTVRDGISRRLGFISQSSRGTACSGNLSLLLLSWF